MSAAVLRTQTLQAHRCLCVMENPSALGHVLVDLDGSVQLSDEQPTLAVDTDLLRGLESVVLQGRRGPAQGRVQGQTSTGILRARCRIGARGGPQRSAQ